MKISELREDFILDQDWSPDTVTWARRMLVIYGKYLEEIGVEPAAVSSGQFTRLLNQLRGEGRSYSGRNGLYTVVQQFYRWLKASGHVDRHPFSDPETKPKRPRKERKVPRTVDLSYIEAILRAASERDDLMGRRNRAIVHLLASTGMRRVEVASLSLSDIHIEAKEMLLRRTKYQHERYAFLTDATLLSLERWLVVRPDCETDRVFITLHGAKNGIYQGIQADVVNKVLVDLKKAAGIPEAVRITPHMLRHTFATHVAEANNPFGLMLLMGHTNLVSTERYVHPSKDQLRQVAQFGPDLR